MQLSTSFFVAVLASASVVHAGFGVSYCGDFEGVHDKKSSKIACQFAIDRGCSDCFVKESFDGASCRSPGNLIPEDKWSGYCTEAGATGGGGGV